MIDTAPAFVAELEAAAIAAQKEELAFRDSIAREMARRERERQFAFRRVGMIRQMAQAAAGAKTEEEAIAAQAVALQRELGWYATNERRKQILAAWRAVSVAVWQAVRPAHGVEGAAPANEEDAPSVARAIETFEAWYAGEHGADFLALLDQDMPEIPVVEF